MALLADDLSFNVLGADDLPAIVAIEQRSHITPWRESHFRSSIEGAHHVVGVFYRTQLVGYAVYSVVVDEAELLLFVIDQSYQGQGVGKQFLTYLIDSLAGKAERLFLEVRASNEPAINLYENAGFNQVGERVNYYTLPWGREDALIFALEII